MRYLLILININLFFDGNTCNVNLLKRQIYLAPADAGPMNGHVPGRALLKAVLRLSSQFRLQLRPRIFESRCKLSALLMTSIDFELFFKFMYC